MGSDSTQLPAPRARGSDWPFVAALAVIGGTYVLLIVASVLADVQYTSLPHLLDALKSREIRYAIRLSLVSCTLTTALCLWVGVPLGYLMSRYRFPLKGLVDAILDIPIVLPPLVVGLSLLILFQTRPGRMLEGATRHHMGQMVAYLVLPLGVGAIVWGVVRGMARVRGVAFGAALVAGVSVAVLLARSALGARLRAAAQYHLATPITYAVPSVILAQFSVACAFAVRTMRVTFDQISPRREHVARTLGCSRSQAFWMVVLPEAWRGVLTAGTLAWARSLGEFGPILVFSGATRMRTEVLSTTVFLELSVGNLDAAVAVSLLMIACATAVLLLVRTFSGDLARGVA